MKGEQFLKTACFSYSEAGIPSPLFLLYRVIHLYVSMQKILSYVVDQTPTRQGFATLGWGRFSYSAVIL